MVVKDESRRLEVVPAPLAYSARLGVRFADRFGSRRNLLFHRHPTYKSSFLQLGTPFPLRTSTESPPLPLALHRSLQLVLQDLARAVPRHVFRFEEDQSGDAVLGQDRGDVGLQLLHRRDGVFWARQHDGAAELESSVIEYLRSQGSPAFTHATCSPWTSQGTGTTAASRTAAWCESASSTMTDAMFSPERTICRGARCIVSCSVFRREERIASGEEKGTHDILRTIRNKEEPFLIQVTQIAAAGQVKRQEQSSSAGELNRSKAHERNQPSSSNAFRVAASSRQ